MGVTDKAIRLHKIAKEHAALSKIFSRWSY